MSGRSSPHVRQIVGSCPELGRPHAPAQPSFGHGHTDSYVRVRQDVGVEEIALTGGNMDPVVRIGDTVRRVSGAWTASVHDLLRRCADAGIHEVPRPLGTDAQGREVLSYIEGDVLALLLAEIQWSASILQDAGRLLRRIHDAGTDDAGTGLAPALAHGTWRSATHHPVEVVCHNDFAPYNLIVRDERLVGVIDFDMASPGPRIWDLAYLAYRLVPFAEDAPEVDPDRFGTRERRLRALIGAYGGPYTDAEVLAVGAVRLDDLATFTDQRAAQTGRGEFVEHAAMYRRDAARLRALASA